MYICIHVLKFGTFSAVLHGVRFPHPSAMSKALLFVEFYCRTCTPPEKGAVTGKETYWVGKPKYDEEGDPNVSIWLGHAPRCATCNICMRSISQSFLFQDRVERGWYSGCEDVHLTLLRLGDRNESLPSCLDYCKFFGIEWSPFFSNYLE